MTTPATSPQITFREASRNPQYGLPVSEINNQHLSLGALLRIADAMESMAADRAAIIQEIDTLRTSLDDANAIIKRLSMEVAGLKGAIARHRIPVHAPVS